MRIEWRSDEVLAAHSKALNEALEVVDGRLAEAGWVDGEVFSTAKIAMGAPMHGIFDVDGPRRSFPAIVAWIHRLRNRSAYRINVMASYDELRA